MARARRIAQISARRIIAVLIREHAVEHEDLLAAVMHVFIKAGTGGVTHDAGGARDLITDPVEHGAGRRRRGEGLAKSLSGHHEVICLKRDEYASTEFDSGSIVIHAAAKVHQRGSKTPKELAEYTKANCELTLTIARNAVKNKVKLMIFMSTALLMGGQEGSFSEDTTPAPDMPYGMSKLAAEWGLKNLFAVTKTSACVALRLPMIYGENAKGNYALLIKLARLGVPLPLASVTRKGRFCLLEIWFRRLKP